MMAQDAPNYNDAEDILNRVIPGLGRFGDLDAEGLRKASSYFANEERKALKRRDRAFAKATAEIREFDLLHKLAQRNALSSIKS